jgi:1,4-dihydroxy-2-naphthoate octaprenyltransferase
MIKDYLAEVFEPTLLFSLFAGIAGVAAAYHFGMIHIWFSVFAVIAVIFAQVGVNLIGDYVDFKSGLDKETTATNFSGGSKLVAEGVVDSRLVLSIGLVATLIAAMIGVYFVLMQVLLLPLFVFGALCVFFYSKYITKVPFLADLTVALCFIAISIGCFVVASGSFVYSYLVLLVLAPPGIEVACAAIANSIPDRNADRRHGRKNSVSVLWDYKRMAKYYLFIQILTYAILLYGVVSGAVPYIFLLSLGFVVPYLYVARGIHNYKDPKSYERYMAVQAIASFALYLLMIAIYLV